MVTTAVGQFGDPVFGMPKWSCGLWDGASERMLPKVIIVGPKVVSGDFVLADPREPDRESPPRLVAAPPGQGCSDNGRLGPPGRPRCGPPPTPVHPCAPGARRRLDRCRQKLP